MNDKRLLARLAADLVDGRTLHPLGGAPWDVVAEELDRLHAYGFTLTDLAAAVRTDLTEGITG